MLNVENASFDVKMEVYESVVVPTLTYGTGAWGMKIRARHELEVMEMKCPWNMCSDQDGLAEGCIVLGRRVDLRENLVVEKF